MDQIQTSFPELYVDSRGRGMIRGLETRVPEAASEIARLAFEDRLLIETAGPADEVVKLLPPLTVSTAAIDRALEIINAASATLAPLYPLDASEPDDPRDAASFDDRTTAVAGVATAGTATAKDGRGGR